LIQEAFNISPHIQGVPFKNNAKYVIDYPVFSYNLMGDSSGDLASICLALWSLPSINCSTRDVLAFLNISVSRNIVISGSTVVLFGASLSGYTLLNDLRREAKDSVRNNIAE
jgi:hypothetical protein